MENNYNKNYYDKYIKYKKKYLETNNNKQHGGYNILQDYKEVKYVAAGIIFTDKKHVLSGYQVGMKKNYISGIGGGVSPSDNSNPKITAIRETLEELFGIEFQNILSEDELNKNIELFNEINSLIVERENNINDIEQIKNIIKNFTENIGIDYNLIEINNNKINQLIEKINLIEVKEYIYDGEYYVNFIFTFENLNEMLGLVKNSGLTSKFYDQIPENIFDLISKRKENKSEVQQLALLPLQKNLLVDPNFIEDIECIKSNKNIYQINNNPDNPDNFVSGIPNKTNFSGTYN